MSLPILEISNLRVAFQGTHKHSYAVDDVSFSLMPGEIMGIVGESGSGKSLTCMALAGLAPGGAELSGEVSIAGGRFLLSQIQQAKFRRNLPPIGIVFQEPISSLNPLMAVGSQIAEAAMMTGVSKRTAKARALELIADVKIPDPESTYYYYPSQLSGGMCQRIMIAIALAMQPALIIADEPTTALDVTIQAQVIELLKSLVISHHIPMIFISHDLDLVSSVCHRIVVMHHGRIVEAGDAATVCTSPQHPYTRSLLDAMPGQVPPHTLLIATQESDYATG